MLVRGTDLASGPLALGSCMCACVCVSFVSLMRMGKTAAAVPRTVVTDCSFESKVYIRKLCSMTVITSPVNRCSRQRPGTRDQVDRQHLICARPCIANVPEASLPSHELSKVLPLPRLLSASHRLINGGCAVECVKPRSSLAWSFRAECCAGGGGCASVSAWAPLPFFFVSATSVASLSSSKGAV